MIPCWKVRVGRGVNIKMIFNAKLNLHGRENLHVTENIFKGGCRTHPLPSHVMLC